MKRRTGGFFRLVVITLIAAAACGVIHSRYGEIEAWADSMRSRMESLTGLMSDKIREEITGRESRKTDGQATGPGSSSAALDLQEELGSGTPAEDGEEWLWEEEETPGEPEPMDHALDYAYTLLTEEQQACYDTICRKLDQEKPWVKVRAATYEDIRAAMTAVRNDRPEYFWFRNFSSSYITDENGVEAKITVSGICEPEEISGMAEEIRQKVQEIVEPYRGLSEYEKVKAMYIWLVEHTVYDTDYSMQNCYQVLVQGRGICTGYARSMQLLLRELGVQALWVGNENHAWNIVRIDGEYYHVDVTHGDPVMEDGTQSLNFYYLNLTDEEIAATEDHELIGLNLEIPACTATTYNYYRWENRMITAEDRSQVRELYRLAIENRENEVTFRAETREIYDWLLETFCQGTGTYFALRKLGWTTYEIAYTTREELLAITIDLELFEETED